jgi:hypothetical protein
MWSTEEKAQVVAPESQVPRGLGWVPEARYDSARRMVRERTNERTKLARSDEERRKRIETVEQTGTIGQVMKKTEHEKEIDRIYAYAADMMKASIFLTACSPLLAHFPCSA